MAANTLFSSNLVINARASSTASSSRLSSKNANPLSTKVANAPGMQRLVSLVCQAKNADAAPNAVQAAIQAVRDVEVPSVVRPALATAVANVLMATPAHAGVLFDFNATLPIIMGQFLVLMFILDKVVFTPVGATLDARDANVREQVAAVGDNSAEIEKILAEAQSKVTGARAEVKKLDEVYDKEKNAEADKILAAAKAELEREMSQAMAALETSKAESEAELEKQLDVLSDEIVEKVLNTSGAELKATVAA